MDIVTKKLYYKTNQSNLLSKYALKKLQKAKSKHKIKPLLSSRKSIIENRNQTNNSIASPLAPIETNTPNDNLAVDYENNSYQLEELDYEETSDENFLVDDELSNVMDTISENDSLCDDDEEFPFPRNLCLYDQSSNQIHEAVQYDCFDYDEFFDCDGEMDQPENNAYKPQTLDELITTEGFSDIIKTPVNISALNLLFFILRFSTENNLSVSALSNLFTLINSMFKYPIFPESRYMIDKFFNGNPNASFHAICRNTECNTYLGKLETLDPLSECKVCGTIVGKIDHTSTNFYVLMDPTNAIINSIKSNENYYDYIMSVLQSIDILDMIFERVDKKTLKVAKFGCMMWEDRAMAQMRLRRDSNYSIFFDEKVEGLLKIIRERCDNLLMVLENRWFKEILFFKEILIMAKEEGIIDFEDLQITWSDVRNVFAHYERELYKENFVNVLF
uniref:Uncharacterized protein n=1 Tax=Trichogramma kaykai TaxID=54128 RepID=A0ABD2VUZ9_9HYME